MTNRILIPIILLTMAAGTRATADEVEKSPLVTGKVSLTGKYDSDIGLTLGQYGDARQSDDMVEELAASIETDQTFKENWRLNVGLQGFGDWPLEHRDSSWYVGNLDLYVGYTKNKNTVSLLNTSRYFTVPRNRRYDFFKNSATLAYSRVFSDLFEGRIGYENIANVYIENSGLSYFLNGGFLELRNTWTPLFSTYYMYDFLYYQGSMSAEQNSAASSWNSGYRHTGELGFDWVFAAKNNLTAAYTFQLDRSEQDNFVQYGDFTGDHGALESDAEFNFIKHKGSLLFSHRFNHQFSLTLYNEFIYKYYLSRATDSAGEGTGEQHVSASPRTDLLFLTSAWLTIRFFDNFYGKIRYIFRMDNSTDNAQDYQDHITSVGLEFRF